MEPTSGCADMTLMGVPGLTIVPWASLQLSGERTDLLRSLIGGGLLLQDRQQLSASAGHAL
jgi:hypothetical protein